MLEIWSYIDQHFVFHIPPPYDHISGPIAWLLGAIACANNVNKKTTKRIFISTLLVEGFVGMVAFAAGVRIA